MTRLTFDIYSLATPESMWRTPATAPRSPPAEARHNSGDLLMVARHAPNVINDAIRYIAEGQWICVSAGQ